MFCKTCGTKIEDGTKFCPSCGASLGSGASGISGLPKERKMFLGLFIGFMILSTIFAFTVSSSKGKSSVVKTVKNIAFLEQTVGQSIPFGKVVDVVVSDPKWDCEKIDNKNYTVTLSGGIKKVEGLAPDVKIPIEVLGLDKAKFRLNFDVEVDDGNVFASTTGGSIFLNDMYKNMNESDAAGVLTLLYGIYVSKKN